MSCSSRSEQQNRSAQAGQTGCSELQQYLRDPYFPAIENLAKARLHSWFYEGLSSEQAQEVLCTEGVEKNSFLVTCDVSPEPHGYYRWEERLFKMYHTVCQGSSHSSDGCVAILCFDLAMVARLCRRIRPNQHYLSIEGGQVFDVLTLREHMEVDRTIWRQFPTLADRSTSADSLSARRLQPIESVPSLQRLCAAHIVFSVRSSNDVSLLPISKKMKAYVSGGLTNCGY